MNKKILLCHPSFYIYGGGEYAIVYLVNNLAKTNNVTIITTKMIDDVKKDLDESIIVKEFKDLGKVHEFVKESSVLYDVYLAINHPAELFSISAKCKAVWYQNEPPDNLLHGGVMGIGEYNIVQKFVDKIIVADSFNKNRVKMYYWKDAKIVPYGVDTEFWNPILGNEMLAENKYGLKPEDFVVLHPGWYAPFKNQMRTLEALIEVKEKIPNIKVVFVGMPNTQYFQAISTFVGSNNLQDNVVLGNFCSRESLRDLYARANVVCLPYRLQGGFLSVFEALSMQKNVIVPENLPFKELLTKLKLFQTDDIEGTLLKLYKKGLQEKVLRKNRLHLVRKLTWEQFAKGVEAILDSLEEKTEVIT